MLLVTGVDEDALGFRCKGGRKSRRRFLGVGEGVNRRRLGNGRSLGEVVAGGFIGRRVCGRVGGGG